MDQNKTNSDNNEETTTETETNKSPKYCITAERLNQIKKIVEEAIREKKTFVIRGGFNIIRNALLQRGWLEKVEVKLQLKNPSEPIEDICSILPAPPDSTNLPVRDLKCEKMIMSRLLYSHDVDFFWSMRKDTSEWQERLNKNKIINRFSRSLFTSKEGLCLLLQQMYWYREPGIECVRFPRCYTINFADQCATFMEDFRLTACISLLRWFTTTLHNEGEASIYSLTGKVPMAALHFAIDRCNEYTAVQRHLDTQTTKVWEQEWDQFLGNFQLLLYKGEKFNTTNDLTRFADERAANLALKNIIPHWPQYELDGVRNIWIMKPGNKCRGRDIQLIKDVDEVLKVMNHKLKYVIQKYIERPLLIYDTKFDIRQWFMVTCVQPLTIWMYRDCYLRFSSRTFNLDNFHESVHLTNHAVQHKYRNEKHDTALPEDKMWDNHTFKTYLRQTGHADKWYKVIYPGMRECIIGAMLASQDTMDRRPNTFELYGADFMISEDFTPWLIEINSCPAMGPTTSVTARMCPQCFEDMVKVIVDHRRNVKADTGSFELIYKQNVSQTPVHLGSSLPNKTDKIRRIITKQKSQKNIQARKEPKKVLNLKSLATDRRNYKGPIIDNLIEEIQTKVHFEPKPTVVDKLEAPSTSRKSPEVPHTELSTKPAPDKRDKQPHSQEQAQQQQPQRQQLQQLNKKKRTRTAPQKKSSNVKPKRASQSSRLVS